MQIFEACVRIFLFVNLFLNNTLLTDESIDSGNFSVRAYLPLIRKDSRTRMHSLAVYVKEGLPSARDLSLENSADASSWLYLTQYLTSFSSIDYLLRLCAWFLILFHLT